jgi:pimeloyl-ACP methyl ester carboxylesterase
MGESLQMQVQGEAKAPVLVYLPGLHGDWHYNAGLRLALQGRVRLVELAYPREPAWKLEDYVQAIEAALLGAGIGAGWLLGESFGSQVAWGLIGRAESQQAAGRPHFQPRGLVLAGGFVRYPLMWGVRLVRGTHQSLPMAAVAALLRAYLRLLRWRHRQAAHVQQSLQQHQDFQLQELARQAILSRYDIILAHDHRPLARRTQFPVYYLTGFWDLIVPWFLVQPWLRRHCPGYRGWRLVWDSEHNILGFQPRTSAEQILAWMKACGEPVS